MPTSDFPDFWKITGICLDLFPWPPVVMSPGTMTTSYFDYVEELCHITSILWKGVSGKVYIVYGNPFTLFVFKVFEGCLLTHC